MAITQQMDTTTPMGKMMCHICAAFAEMERDLIAERVKAGLAKAKRQGVRLGRPRVPDSKASRVTLWRRKRFSPRS